MSPTSPQNLPHSSQPNRLNPSVRPFYSRRSSTQAHGNYLWESPVSTKPAQLAFPPYRSERVEMYQQAPNSAHCSFPPSSLMNGLFAPHHNPEALIADMWKTCPALCASIRNDFDLNAVFHPTLIARHGETFLRLAATQIAMQNQATEMRNMKQRLLDVNAKSAKDLRTNLMSQRSALEKIKGRLEQQPQAFTAPGASEEGKARQSSCPESRAACQGLTMSPTTVASSLWGVDSPTCQFYARSAALPSLNASLPTDNIEKHVEGHGYGHAETRGPAFQFDCVDYGTITVKTWCQPSSVPPISSTSPIFELDPSSDDPMVSIAADERTSFASNQKENVEKAESNSCKHQTTTACDMNTPARIRIMKRRDGGDKDAPLLSKTATTPNVKTPKEESCIHSANPALNGNFDGADYSQADTTATKRLVSYAAAVRTSPTTSHDPSAAEPPTTTSDTSPSPDLGFTLEPLPKPSFQQVQSQQQQPSNVNTNGIGGDITFDFAAWKQQKLAAGTWVDRPKLSNIHHSRHPPFLPSHRGRGGRLQQQKGNFSSGPADEEPRKREWLAWKRNLVSQGKWNPRHPFKEAWRND